MDLCGVDRSRAAQALSALAYDAQSGTCLSQKSLRNVPVTDYDPRIRARTHAFCRQLGLPQLNWDLALSRNNATGPSTTTDAADNDANNNFGSDGAVAAGVATTKRKGGRLRNGLASWLVRRKSEKVYKPLPFQCIVSGDS